MRDLFLLDMDDTLLDFGRAEEENLRRTFAEAGISFTEEMHSRFHVINDGLWKMLERGEIERERLKVRRFELLFEEFGCSYPAEKIARSYFSNFQDICFPFEGAVDFLKELSRRGKTYLVTNGGTDIQRSHIALAGFAPYLADVFISEELGADKPSTEFGNAVKARIHGFSETRAILMGDSLTSDRLCADRMGIPFFRFQPSLPAPSQYSAFLSLISDSL